MPASGIKLVDANVWLALSFSDHVHHSISRQWFDEQPESVCAFCRLTQMALLRHLTNVKVMGKYVQTQQQAWNATPSLQRWTDSYLAAVAKIVGAQVVTFDRGFKSFEKLDIALLA